MKLGLVSVIIPVYNTGPMLAECIESILRQTYNNVELLITDDGSDDETTLRILSDYAAKDERVRVLRLEKNMGAGRARNHSIGQAEGQYIAFCDSDDRWTDDKLERQISFMQRKGCCLTYSSYYLCDRRGSIRGIVKAPQRVSLAMLMRDNKIGCLTSIYDASIYGKFYLPKIRKRQDWALFLNILSKCEYAYGLAEPLAYYNKVDDSLSRRKTSLVKYNVNVYHKILDFPWPKAYLYFLFVFMPCYLAKVTKVRIDSYRLRKSLGV